MMSSSTDARKKKKKFLNNITKETVLDGESETKIKHQNQKINFVKKIAFIGFHTFLQRTHQVVRKMLEFFRLHEFGQLLCYRNCFLNVLLCKRYHSISIKKNLLLEVEIDEYDIFKSRIT